ncbi:TSUP family transporter [Craterilacuibacter sp. RT1T]|uniref:sulfite exporter TauE/SafE family protein n=1 Tax=Craterilacuibacter sp. RT1T TaxID=2942211 RepID=UPI0020BE2440|nr:TSUP family transporter [Craterilacuibacter sp. RT1T]MCL6262953.1 TSUP family transporter [Craterilacuibacter sp. RT1T]
MPETLTLVLIAFASGIAGATVGGAGLLQLPALFNAYPAASTMTVIGTNKIAFTLGGLNNVRHYWQNVGIPWRQTLPALIAGSLTAYGGAALLQYIPGDSFKPLLLVLMIVLAVYLFRHKKLGEIDTPPLLDGNAALFAAILAGLVLGFYEGVFGPATLTFLALLYNRLFGMNLKRALAAGQILTNGWNIAALGFFVPHGNYLLGTGLMMGVAAIAGSFTGIRLIARGGNTLIRRLFMALLVIEIGRYSYLLWR